MRAEALSCGTREDLGWHTLVGTQSGLAGVLRRAQRVARTDDPCLICGETGTGKSLLAQVIHAQSLVAKGPFVEFPCSSFNDNLIEAELFGHVRGAFTSAESASTGKISLAQGGTFFLDEVGELSLSTQARLLHFLQEGRYYPVGSHTPRSVRTRIIAATNRDLRQMVARGTFREDLFYRLSVIWLEMPTLRNRRDDILMLAQEFLRRYQEQTGRELRLSESVQAALLAYSWPGNIRELSNTLRRAFLDVDDGQQEITSVEFVSPGVRAHAASAAAIIDAEDLEWNQIKQALLENRGHMSKAADRLGVSRFALYRRLKKLGIDRSSAMTWFLQEHV